MDFNLNFHPLDNLIKDKTSFWLEALVPFVDYKYKKYLILYIKYKEITAIMSALEDLEYVESRGFNCKAHSMDDIISGLAGFMPQDFSDNIKQMKSMIDMMSAMNSMDGGMPNINQFMNFQGSPKKQYGQQGTSSYYQAPPSYTNPSHHTASHHTASQDNEDLLENIKSILDQDH